MPNATGKQCRCGHVDFPAIGQKGHFRGSGDTSRERTGPCQVCSCTSFQAVAVVRPKGRFLVGSDPASCPTRSRLIEVPVPVGLDRTSGMQRLRFTLPGGVSATVERGVFHLALGFEVTAIVPNDGHYLLVPPFGDRAWAVPMHCVIEAHPLSSMVHPRIR